MTTTVLADIQYLSKQLYAKGYKSKDLYRKKPLLDAAEKNTKFASAEGLNVSQDSNLGNGVGGTIAGAVVNATASTGVKFLVPQKSMFGYVEMDSLILRNAKESDDDGKVYDYAKKQYADGLETVMFEMSRQAYGTGTGSRATVLTATGTTITVAPSEAVFFRKNMRVRGSATDGAALAAGTPGYTVIQSVDTATGTLTTSGTITTEITGITAGWSLYQDTIASNNNTANGGWMGLGGYNPITVTGTLFMGVNRLDNPSVLAGCRYTAGGPLESLFIRARAQAMTEIGPQWDEGDIYLHPLQFAAYESIKEGVKDVRTSDDYELGIKRISYRGHTFVEDVACPLLWAHVVGDGAFTINTCGNQPKFGEPFEDPGDEKIKAKANLDGNFSALTDRLQRVLMPSP